jgi:hypothetical protein
MPEVSGATAQDRRDRFGFEQLEEEGFCLILFSWESRRFVDHTDDFVERISHRLFLAAFISRDLRARGGANTRVIALLHGAGLINVNEGDRRRPITFDHVHSEGIDPHVSPDPVRMEVMTFPINKIMIGQLLADSFAFALIHALREIFSACGEDPQEAQRGRFFSGCVEEFQHQGAQLGVSHRPIMPSSSGKSSYFFATVSY